ncbi:MAG: hypothetical protein WBN60_14840, partial [Polyangiales bacterium]
MRFSVSLLFLSCAVHFVAGCGSDSSSGTAGTSGSGGSGGQGGSGGMIPAPPLGCDPLTPSYCAFPYPNDYYTVADPST